jgi:hypothetical protein
MFHYVPLQDHGRSYMQDKIKNEWTALVQEGIRGQAVRFKLRAAKLAQMLQKLDPELAGALAAGLTGDAQDLARDATPRRLEDSATNAGGLLSIESNVVLEFPAVWTEPVRNRLEAVVEEWSQSALLEEAQLQPIKTVLMHGPPGVGKSLAARWLAHSLSLPLATLNLSAVINSYLGRTGQNISQVLDYAKRNACVLFLDEFDALAKRRDDNQDVGELKRVVNVLLQAVDQWDAPSLLVAATNHPQLLDAAMFRRFDQVVEFPPVTASQATQSLEVLGVTGELARKLGREMLGYPLSEVYRRVQVARKQAILQQRNFEDMLPHVWAMERSAINEVDRRRQTVAMMHSEGKTARAIAKELNVSHPTVLRDLAFLQKEDANAD